MATIVRDMTTDMQYVLVGVGYGASKINRPISSISTSSISSENRVVAVADADGHMLWLPAYQVQVMSVDGVSCRELLGESDDDQSHAV